MSQVVQSGAGVVAREISAAALADAVLAVLSDADAYSTLSADALLASQTKFSWSALVDHIDQHMLSEKRTTATKD